MPAAHGRRIFFSHESDAAPVNIAQSSFNSDRSPLQEQAPHNLRSRSVGRRHDPPEDPLEEPSSSTASKTTPGLSADDNQRSPRIPPQILPSQTTRRYLMKGRNEEAGEKEGADSNGN